jgi:hypothetical protein
MVKQPAMGRLSFRYITQEAIKAIHISHAMPRYGSNHVKRVTYFPLSTLCAIGILLILWKFFLEKPQLLSQAIPVIFIITVCTAFVSNFLIFGLDHRNHVSGASTFWMRRPVHTQSLAIAQLYTLMRSLLYVIAIIMLVTLAIVLYEYVIFLPNCPILI